MAKASGGTRNYRPESKTYAKRKSEFESLMNNGYDRVRSTFASSGGFVAVHKDHNPPGTNDLAEEKCKVLAQKGYKVFLDSERSIQFGDKQADGRIYTAKMDCKTISEAGKWTIKNAMEKAVKQDARVAVLIQNTKSMTREYVESQIKVFQEKSPQYCRDNLDYVIVIGMSGNVHRHKLK